MIDRVPGFVIIPIGTVVNSCCALTKRVCISRPSITILTAGVDLSPITCSLTSAGVRAKTLGGETADATNGGVGVGLGGGMETGFGVGGGGSQKEKIFRSAAETAGTVPL